MDLLTFFSDYHIMFFGLFSYTVGMDFVPFKNLPPALIFVLELSIMAGNYRGNNIMLSWEHLWY
jgi:hypothetical protein